MKKIIFYFLVLLLTVWLGVIMHRNPGYILVAYDNISIETSLWFAIIALIVLFIIFHWLLRFSSGVGAVTAYIRQWISNRRSRRAHSQTILGLYELIEGNSERAEKKLSRSAKYSDMPLINHLAAAFMAQNQYELKRRDNHLRLAQKAAQDRPLAAGLIQANLHLVNKQWEEAARILENLKQLYPKNVFVLRSLQTVYTELNNWQSLEELLPFLRKSRAWPINEFEKLEQRVYRELMLQTAKNDSITALWKKLPRYLQKKPVIAAVYIEYLLAKNQIEDAETILKMTLHKFLDEHLLYLYAELPSTQPIKHLMRAEEWLQQNPENADLLLCLGRICRKQKLWGKARNYLEKSVRLKPAVAAFAELAQIAIEQGDLRGALELYAKGLKVE